MKQSSTIQRSIPLSWQAHGFEMPIQRLAKERALARAELQQLKTNLLQPALARAREPQHRRLLDLAGNEALAEASRNPFPLLVLPCLLAEKVARLQRWFRKQQEILARTRWAYEWCVAAIEDRCVHSRSSRTIFEGHTQEMAAFPA